MARRRRGKPKKAREPEVEDVLAGRRSPSHQELFRLIHRVNPTGQDHSRQEEQRLYQQKSALQSLLIRRFGERIVVESGPGEGVVSLVHRSGEFDACHALLAELDVEARSWVQRQLDLGAYPVDRDLGDRDEAGSRRSPGAGEERGEDRSLEELIALGRQAVNDFDYTAGERYLKRALERSRGGSAAALPLLELWVGTLGMDREALESEASLSAEAKTHPKLRYYLALANARLAEDERALELVRGVEDVHAAEVYAALVAHAVRRGDAKAADRYLDRVTRFDSTRPEIPGLTEEIDRLRSERARPAEEELLERYYRRGAESVESEARALQEEWPQSEVARRILREAAAWRKEREIARCLERAHRALAQERFRAAAKFFQKALDAGCDQEDLPPLLEQAEAMAQEREEEARLASALDLFAEAADATPDLAKALLAYLSLERSLRSRARERVAHRALGWLDEMEAPPSGAKAHAAVSAVLALEQASENVSRGLAQEAIDALAPHLRTLRHVDDARRCVEEAESLCGRQRRERAVNALEKARAAAAESQMEAARQLLAEVDLGELPPRERSAAEELAARLRRQEAVAILRREYDHHLETEDWMGALERAEKLAGIDTSEPWKTRSIELRDRIRVAWKVEVSHDHQSLDSLDESFPTSVLEEPELGLDESGRELVLVNSWGRWLFIRVIDVEESKVISRISLRTPLPLGDLALVASLEGGHLRILGSTGIFLELERDGWQVLRWFDCRELLPRQVKIEQNLVICGSPYLWLVTRMPVEDDWKNYVIDTGTGRVCRKLSCDFVHPIVGAEEPLVLSQSFEDEAKLFSARGTPVPGLSWPPDLRILSAAARPDGEGFLVVAIRLDLGEDVDRMEMIEFLRTPSGAFKRGPGIRIPDVYEDAGQTISTARDPKLCFLLANSYDRRRELLAFGAADASEAVEGSSGLRQLYRVLVPNGTILFRDWRSRNVCAVTAGENGVTVRPLGPEPPSPWPPQSGTSVSWIVPQVKPPLFCGSLDESQRVVVDAIAGRMRSSAPMAVYRDFEKNFGEDVHQMALVCRAFELVDRASPDWPALAGKLSRQDPTHPEVAMIMAELAAKVGLWDEAYRYLEPVDPEKLSDHRRCHFHHLSGLALLHLDRPAEALVAFEDFTPEDSGLCHLSSMAELARELAQPSRPEEGAPDPSFLRRVVAMIRAADRAFWAGDYEAARVALECPLMFEVQELQTAARLAEVYFKAPPAQSDCVFRKRYALSFYLYLRREKGLERDFDLPGLSWGAARLSEIAERSLAWLEESVSERSESESGQAQRREMATPGRAS